MGFGGKPGVEGQRVVGKQFIPYSHNHGSGKWVTPILVSFHLGKQLFLPSRSLTASLPLKNGWQRKTSLSFWVPVDFGGRTVQLPGGYPMINPSDFLRKSEVFGG